MGWGVGVLGTQTKCCGPHRSRPPYSYARNVYTCILFDGCRLSLSPVNPAAASMTNAKTKKPVKPKAKAPKKGEAKKTNGVPKACPECKLMVGKASFAPHWDSKHSKKPMPDFAALA